MFIAEGGGGGGSGGYSNRFEPHLPFARLQHSIAMGNAHLIRAL